MNARADIGIGSEFVGYRIDELLGRGGMGVVFRAYDLRLKRAVALKLMAPELALDRRFRERFSRETELAMSLEHPNVVPIHDAGDVGGRLYLAMRLVEGTDLRALLRAEGALDATRSLAVCGGVASALDAAHGRGLVHRDVKPSNVLLDPDEHVYLADFGLTRRLDEQGDPVGEQRSVGTPAYLAPEQIEGGPLDGRTDVYALGCLLYECLAGEAPFARGSRLAAAWAHLEEEPPSVHERRPELPAAIDAVIRKAMAKDPAERFASCAELVGAATEALGLRRAPAPRRTKPAALAAVAAVLVVAAGVTAAIVRGGHGRHAAPPVVEANSLVRIDPATNSVRGVARVGRRPAATAVGGGRVWVYDAGGSQLSEVDAATGRTLHTGAVAAPAGGSDAFTGPVLAADAAGAWLVGEDRRGRPCLTRVLSGPHGRRAYPLPGDPRAVAVGSGGVWVIVRTGHDREVLRIDPATGAVVSRTRFPRSSLIDGLAAGLGRVWVTASATARLYRIDPRSAAVTGSVDLGTRASRPEVVLGAIWVGVSDRGGDTLVINPRLLRMVEDLGCCSPGGSRGAAGYGSIWMYDAPTGDVVRWSGLSHQVAANIHVADPPFYGGLCLTSIAAGAGAVWVTVAANVEYGC